MQQAKGVSLSPATEPFSPKLVERIRSGQFVDMRELMTDNIALLHQMESFGTNQYPLPILPGSLRPRLREATSISSWMFAFLAYVAIRADNIAIRNMLAYARLILHESQRHGGNGWISYDKVFRQQAAIDETMAWNTIHPGIQATTLLGQAPGQGVCCTLCRESDHVTAGCALGYLQEAPAATVSNRTDAAVTSTGQRPRQSVGRRPDPGDRVCKSWNKGECTYPRCSYRHVCSTCNRRHMASDCPDIQGGSEYKNQRAANPP